jgi:hypothetical protein
VDKWDSLIFKDFENWCTCGLCNDLWSIGHHRSRKCRIQHTCDLVQSQCPRRLFSDFKKEDLDLDLDFERGSLLKEHAVIHLLKTNWKVFYQLLDIQLRIRQAGYDMIKKSSVKEWSISSLKKKSPKTLSILAGLRVEGGSSDGISRRLKCLSQLDRLWGWCEQLKCLSNCFEGTVVVGLS